MPDSHKSKEWSPETENSSHEKGYIPKFHLQNGYAIITQYIIETLFAQTTAE